MSYFDDLSARPYDLVDRCIAAGLTRCVGWKRSNASRWYKQRSIYLKTDHRKTVCFDGLIAIVGVVSFLIAFGAHVSATMAAPNTVPNPVSPVYVALDGNDANPGTKDNPYAMLQKAMDTAPTGSFIWIRGGVYHQHLTIHRSGGKDGNFLTIESYPGEHAVLDGHALTSHDGGLIQIVDSNNIRIRNITIQDY